LQVIWAAAFTIVAAVQDDLAGWYLAVNGGPHCAVRKPPFAFDVKRAVAAACN